MSGPEMLLGGSAATSIVGGFVGAAGAQSQAAYTAAGARMKAQAEAGAARYNAGMFDNAALINERDRRVALDQSVADAETKGRIFAAQRGQIRAAYGANGLSMEGSPLDVLEATAVEQDLDVRKTLYTGEVVAAGLTDQANQNRARASLLRYQADNAIVAGNLTADGAYSAAAYQSAASILGGFSSAASSGARFFTPGR